MKKVILLIFIFLMIISNIKAQGIEDSNYSDNIISPSPTSSELGKFGQIPVGLNTGTPNIQIPLYTLKTKNLSLPIYLSYSSNGIRVNEVASWAGLGWSLNAGGLITRTIKGQADEDGNRFVIDDKIFDMSIRTKDAVLLSANAQWDTEPDIFTYNFMGHAGRFVLDDKMQAISISHDNLKYDIDLFNEKICITTADGIIYCFGGEGFTETSMTDVKSSEDANKHGTGYFSTAWFLEKIIHPKGDIIHFAYTSDYISYNSALEETRVRLRNSSNICSPTESDPIKSEDIAFVSNTKTLRLSEIFSDNSNKIIVNSEPDRNDTGKTRIVDLTVLKINTTDVLKQFLFNTSYSYSHHGASAHFYSSFGAQENKYRLFLDSISIYDSHGKTDQAYTFEYIDRNALPIRLSYDQDYGGYYNGAGNVGFIPNTENNTNYISTLLSCDREVNPNFTQKGLLNKITYPTRGYSLIEYEQNTKYGTKIVEAPKVPLEIRIKEIDTPTHPTEIKTSTLDINFDQDVDINLTWEFYSNADGYDPIHDFGELRIYDYYDPTNVYVDKKVNNDKTRSYSSLFLKKGKYKAELKARGVMADCAVNIYRKINNDQTIITAIDLPGVRIKKETNSSGEVKNYYYCKKENLSVSRLDNSVSYEKPSSIELGTPYYHRSMLYKKRCSDGNVASYDYDVLESNSLNPLFSTNTSSVQYEYVVVGENDDNKNGFKETKFLYSYNVNGTNILRGNYLHGYYDTEHNYNGLIDKITLFKLDDKIVKISETINNYIEDTRKFQSLFAIHSQKAYEKYYYDSLYEIESGDTIWNNQYLENYDVMLYKVKSKWIYNKNQTVLSYDSLGANPISNDIVYTYSNPEHALVTEEEKIMSDVFSIKNRFSYPSDYITNATDEQKVLLNTLITNNQIDLPVEKVKIIKKNNVEVISDGELVKYSLDNNVVNVRSISKFNKNVSDYYEVSRLDKYENNNPTRIITNESDTTCYLWAYNNRYPVAKISGVNILKIYDILSEQMIDQIGVSSDPDFIATQLSLIQGIDDLKVDTYSYDLDYGIISQTDPNGITTYYEYDNFGRLSSIKNDDNQLVQAYDYHYAGEPSAPSTLNLSQSSLNFDSTFGIQNVSITSNVDWTVSVSGNPSWVAVSPSSGSNNGSISITCLKNETTSSRNATLTISGGGLTKTVSVTQAAPTNLDLNLVPITIDAPTDISLHDSPMWDFFEEHTAFYLESYLGSYSEVGVLAIDPYEVDIFIDYEYASGWIILDYDPSTGVISFSVEDPSVPLNSYAIVHVITSEEIKSFGVVYMGM